MIKLQESQKLHHRIIEKQINKRMLRENYIPPERRQKIIDDLILKEEN